MKKALIVIVVIAVLGFIGLGACSSGGGSTVDAESSNGSTTEAEPEKATYELTDEQLVDKGYGVYYITGTLVNNSGTEKKYVQIEYVLKDESGAQIGTGLANTNNLAADGVWKYEALCSVSGDAAPVTFEVADVTSF